MEDFFDYCIWCGEFIVNVYYFQVVCQFGDYLVQVLFYISDFYFYFYEKKVQVVQFINLVMCEIIEDLFFNDLYQIYECNNYLVELEVDVVVLCDDVQFKLVVVVLKYCFFVYVEVLLYGDIYSGLIFVVEGSLKVIDVEFGYFGFIGFDIGIVIGNLLLNYCGLLGQFGICDVVVVCEQWLNDIYQLWIIFVECFQVLVVEKICDVVLVYFGYVFVFLKKVWVDVVGFCGSELICCSVGLLYVVDIDIIQDDVMCYECLCYVIILGRVLIVLVECIDSVDELLVWVCQYS